MALLPHEEDRFHGLSLLYWTIMGPQGTNRPAHRLEFCECRKGLGVKIIGGYRELTDVDYGIYIKRVLAGGLAALDGRLKSGDLILEVNNMSLGEVTNERAVDILRSASASNHMSLVVVRDDESRKEFLELMEKYGSNSSASSGRISPTQLSIGKLTDTASSSSSSRSTSPTSQLLSPKDGGVTTYPLTPPYTSSPLYTTNPTHTTHTTPYVFNDSAIQLICVSKGTGLGLVIKGGANRAEGPMILIQEIVPGGDCQRDGRLMPGDQLVSVNKESFIGVTYEEAKSVITRTKLRPDPTVEIAFIRRRSSISSSSGTQAQDLLQNTGALHPKITSTPNPTSETLPPLNLSQVRRPQSASNKDGESSYRPQRKGSLTPNSRLNPERLEQALDTLGLTPTEAQKQLLKARLRADPSGSVAYADFETITRELFKLQSKELGVGHGARFAPDNLSVVLEVPTNPRPSLSDSSEDLEEMERLRKDHIEALRDIKKLQEKLVESQKLHHQMQEELNKVKQEVRAGTVESRGLRSRIHLAEAAQQQARGMETDYEEVIHLLEAEIVELKAQRAQNPAKEQTEELKKRVAVLETQLRKSDGAKQGYELSTAKLINFVEVVQDFLIEHQGPVKSSSSGDVKAGASSQGLTARLGKKTPWTAAMLAVEAKELTQTVRDILEGDHLV